jgi:hypothetical protein
VVHGDYRLGNMIVTGERKERIEAVLDWEMGALGDPRADVGYLVATYSEPGGPANPLGTSPVTQAEGFPSRAELVARYEERSGREVEPLPWFEALALWKAAVFCEAICGRYVRGELGGRGSPGRSFRGGRSAASRDRRCSHTRRRCVSLNRPRSSQGHNGDEGLENRDFEAASSIISPPTQRPRVAAPLATAEVLAGIRVLECRREGPARVLE